MHSYEKCDHVSKMCERCGLVGHSIRVHFTNSVELCELLIQQHPQEFKHFLAPEPVHNPWNRSSRGPRVGLHRGIRDQGSSGSGNQGSRGNEVNQGGRGQDHGDVDQGNRGRGRGGGGFGKGRNFIRSK